MAQNKIYGYYGANVLKYMKPKDKQTAGTPTISVDNFDQFNAIRRLPQSLLSFNRRRIVNLRY